MARSFPFRPYLWYVYIKINKKQQKYLNNVFLQFLWSILCIYILSFFLRYTVNLMHCKLNFMQNSCNERLCARGGVRWQRLPHLGLSPHSRPLPLTLLGWHQVPERSVSRDFRLHFFPLSHESNPPTVIWIYHAVSNNRLITSITSCGRIVH